MTKLLERLVFAACVVGIVAGVATVVLGVVAGRPQVRLEMSELPPQTLRRIVREEMEAEFTRLEVMREALRDDLEGAKR